MKKKEALVIILLGLILLIVVCYFSISNWKRGIQVIEQTKDAEDSAALLQVSERVGRDFNDWQSLREYVWCELLEKGMTRQEINMAMEKIGDRPVNDELYWGIRFKNEYLNYYLAPIILRFDGPTIDAKLVSWEASPEEHIGAPRASCEAADFIIEK